MPRPEKKKQEKGLYEGVSEWQHEKKAVEKTPGFIRVTRMFSKFFPNMGAKSQFTDEQKQAIAFMNLRVNPQEVYSAYYAIMIFGFIAALALSIPMLGALDVAGSFDGTYTVPEAIGNVIENATEQFYVPLVILALLCLPIVIGRMYLAYPQSLALKEKMSALGYVPEIVSYLVMSMRLTPNLEKAVEFAATNGRGKIAEDLKKLVWDVQLGTYNSIEEGLDDLAYKWGTYSDDFKHALMLIRSSVLEADEARREALLEKAVNDVLEGSKEKMDLYARKLHQPTVYLYYFGILLPLLLAILLPLGSSLVPGVNLAQASYLIIAYNIFLPLGVYIFGLKILSDRPPTYVPPNIPENFPGLPRKGTLVVKGIGIPYKIAAFIILFGAIYAGYSLDQALIASAPSYVDLPTYVKSLAHLNYPYDEYGIFIGQYSVYGIVLGIAFATSLWLFGKFYARKKIQDEIRGMEGEFKDAIYVLASRLGENRPIEDALKHAREFLPKSKIASVVFAKTLDNITMLGMTLDNALFDKTFGALRNFPSQTIQSGMRMLANSVELGVNVAAKSLINLALQLRNAQKIDESLKRLLEDVTVMLSSMSTFVAPIVLAVISSMQKTIIDSMSSLGTTDAQSMPGTQGLDVGGVASVFSPEIAKNAAEPMAFTLIMGIYVLEVVAILTYFNSQIEDTNNPLHTAISIAIALPIAAVLFSAVSLVAGGALAPPA